MRAWTIASGLLMRRAVSEQPKKPMPCSRTPSPVTFIADASGLVASREPLLSRNAMQDRMSRVVCSSLGLHLQPCSWAVPQLQPPP